MFRDPEKKKLLDELQKLNKQLSKVKGQTEAEKELQLSRENIDSLKKEIANLEIRRDKDREDRAREQREANHKAGLVLKQAEVEKKEAIAEAKIAVKEESMTQREKAFEENMKFMRERFEKEVESMREAHKQMFDLVPKVSVNKEITEHHGETSPAIEQGNSKKKK